jgi:methylmalonyl-CoA/ethylmalonyl-CoA epimerase
VGIQARNPNEDGKLRDVEGNAEPIDEAYDGGVQGAVLTAIDHVGIVVDDLDEAIAEQRDTFGVLVEHRDVWHDEDAEVAILGVGPSAIQLICPLGDDSPFAEFLAEGGPGLHHVGYRVADLDAALAALREAGHELLDEEPRPGPGGTRVAFVHPDAAFGVLIQLVER